MEKPISRKMHGAADYAYAALSAVLPEIAGFEEKKSKTALPRDQRRNLSLHFAYPRRVGLI